MVGRRPSQSARAAARRLRAAHAALAKARIAFADATSPDDAHGYGDREHELRRAALAKHRARLARTPGVVGLAVGNRIVAMTPTDELAVIVAVAKKRSSAALERMGVQALPRSLPLGRTEVPVDVIEVGSFRRHAAAGTEVGVSTDIGTIGIFAFDVPSGEPTMVTAMHLTGLSSYPGGGGARPVAVSPDGQIGYLLRGRTRYIDAAKFAVDDPNVVNNFVPGIGQIRRWRPAVPDDDHTTTVVMRGAVSGRRVGTIVSHCFDVLELDLTNAILVRMATVEGDSGAPLVDLQKNLLGFHIAGNGVDLALFSSAGDVFSALRCNL